MNVLPPLVSLIAGLSAALIAYSALFVRGDLGGVMAYLRARGAARRLAQSGADPASVQAAQDNLHALGQRLGDPALAAQMLPVALLLGAGVAWLVWRLFVQRAATPARTDALERMVYRLAHRRGGRFTLRDLAEHSPLTEAQARQVTGSLLERGHLRRDGEDFVLS